MPALRASRKEGGLPFPHSALHPHSLRSWTFSFSPSPPNYISTLTGLSQMPPWEPSQHLAYVSLGVTDSAKKKFLSAFLAQKGFLNDAPSTRGYGHPDSLQGSGCTGRVPSSGPLPLSGLLRLSLTFVLCFAFGSSSLMSLNI